jgi:hypothetical protein
VYSKPLQNSRFGPSQLPFDMTAAFELHRICSDLESDAVKHKRLVTFCVIA